MYVTVIRSLMYATLTTCPDITYAVQWLAQFTKNPQLKHWIAMKQIFQYLKRTQTHTLTYSRSKSTKLKIFCNVDWASNADWKSTSSYVLLFAGAAVAWSAKKKSTIALSTTEAEYITATHIAKQVLWHQTFCEELSIPQLTTSMVYCNNQAAIVIAHHLEFHTHMKHINIAYHFLHNLVESGTLNIVYHLVRT